MSHRPELTTQHWRTLKKLVLERDNYICWKCGKQMVPGVRETQVDHLIPPPIGTDEPSNLAAACGPCNNSKRNKYTDLPVLTVNW
jgi:5-methylcytosine-specific restriction endonuclease McrA